MFKAIKDEKTIAINETGKFPCLVYDEVIEDTEHTCEDYTQYDGEYLLNDDISVSYQNEKIREERQSRYEKESDPIRLAYDEALARGEDTAEELKQEWLASKDKIREELPYITENE